MDIQMPIVPTATTTATATATVTSTSAKTSANSTNAQAASTTSKSEPTISAEGTFIQVLAGQISQDSADKPTDAAATLAGLMQMLQSLPLMQNGIQNQGEQQSLPLMQNGIQTQGKQQSLPLIQNVIQSQGKQQKAEMLPAVLLQAMNSNGGLADRLLLDPAIQQWFAQTTDLLNALIGKDGAANSNILPIQPTLGPNNTQSLQAQNTLLTLTSMLHNQPSNPLLQHLVEDLQKVMQPLEPLLTNGSLDNPLTNVESLPNALQQQSDNVKAPNTGVFGPTTGLKVPETQFSHKQTVVTEPQDELLDPNNLQAVQMPKSKLELLAARNAVNPSMFSLQSTTGSTDVAIKAGEKPNTDVISTDSTVLNLADMLKAPNQMDHLAKAAVPALSSANFAQEMTQQVLKNLKITLTEGISEAKLSLFPKNLGHVDVKITMHQGQLIAQFAADTLAGKQMLESQLPQLRQSLQSQGLQVEKLEVTQNASMQSSMFQDQRHQQSSKQPSNPNRANSLNYGQESVEFVQELTGATQNRRAVSGNSFDVTA
jgi:flagellar hook-length control protein FliK